jgi:hypothetical protein
LPDTGIVQDRRVWEDVVQQIDVLEGIDSFWFRYVAKFVNTSAWERDAEVGTETVKRDDVGIEDLGGGLGVKERHTISLEPRFEQHPPVEFGRHGLVVLKVPAG